MTTIHRLVLTDPQMTAVHDAITAGTEPVDALIGALKTTFTFLLEPEGKTWDDFGPQTRIDGKTYAIPDYQWLQIGEWLLEHTQAATTDPLQPVSIHLDWMNLGPSSYTAVQ